MAEDTPYVVDDDDDSDNHRCMGDFFPEASQIKFKPKSKARIFFLDFLPFFFVKHIKIALFSLSSSKIDFSDNNRIKNS